MWFLKFVGPASKIAAHKADYDAFLKSISFNSASVAVAPAAPITPAVVQTIPAFSSYTTPDGWTLDPQERPMRVATFHIADGAQKADVIVSMLPADQFGPPEANLNRWRGQVGLEPITDPSKVAHIAIKVGGADGFLFDFASPDPAAADAQQLVVAQVTKGSHTFFFKLLGPAKLVDKQKAHFDAFLQSIQFATE
jgi:hypothetical protein